MKEAVHKTQPMSKLLKDMVALVLGQSGIKYRFFAPDDLWLSCISDQQIFQIINCLVTNAIDSLYDNEGFEILAENRVMKEDDLWSLKPGHYIKIMIKDSGIGISEENLGKIFEPHFTTKSRGVGLGLFVVRAILEKNNGHIMVESKLGIGSTFTVYLPAQCANGKSRLVHEVEEKGKILVMDSEEIVRKFVGTTMAKLGYKVKLTSCGLEAIKLCKQAKEMGTGYDALILDLMLPSDLDGLEMISRLLAIDPQVKVIASSGYYNDPIIINYEEFGFNGALVKPYNLQDIFNLLP